ncbi:MAG: hypothetical protein A2X86_08285 [Bdellovibrionales bacterium GWA2_49_15]|nr:MAG: hypothetical protein A2X86_08285 [Bdellovibrionales bacterium GWA2_49_15]HAZ11241.1 hypothetical protein [Bdellovibrionales bacterium]
METKFTKILSLLCLCSPILRAPHAYAQNSGHIISGSSESSLSFHQSDDNEPTRYFSLGTGYEYAFESGLQLGGSLFTSIWPGGYTESLSFGPGYNFNKEDLQNSFFGTIKYGVVILHNDSYSSQNLRFGTIELAKRFKIFENVSFIPGFEVSKWFSLNDSEPTWKINLLKISIFF